jgi:hypothetical protein
MAQASILAAKLVSRKSCGCPYLLQQLTRLVVPMILSPTYPLPPPHVTNSRLQRMSSLLVRTLHQALSLRQL